MAPECDIPIVIYQPTNPAPRGGLLWMHGGGYIVGTARADYHGIGFAERASCTVISVDYRLAPESTYKESIADCFAALNWMVDNAVELGIDAEPHRDWRGQRRRRLDRWTRASTIAITGVRRCKLQLMLYPMIDDTHDTPSGHEITHPQVWHRKVSLEAWKMYLGDEYGTDQVSPYAAAARATDFSNLPPAFVTVGDAGLVPR